ncbi:T9SS type A sorting domain-containing protein [Winogradskyella sp.]|uniref:T9SS type A sorting domain-containing protein n=1 Tax=Winogradskyella sp. TaxID=1883156 RepID=UPI001B200408|nr:T9SS type A sorting domain-containing protein [Winogradskyella sp.]MBO6880019.1 zinc-dependent metalloprotease [Winogradskyella sp.]
MKNFTLTKSNKQIIKDRNTRQHILLLAFSLLFGLSSLVAQNRVDLDNVINLDSDICELYPADFTHRSSIAVPDHIRENILNRGTGCSTFDVTYSGFTPEAEAAFQFAVDIWSNLLESPIVIRVSASFTPLDPGQLGGASSNGFFIVNGPGLPPNTAYARALAEKLQGAEIPDGTFPQSTDILAEFSSTANFYFGLDASPPANQIDFVSVVLHELGHGLGIAGFARVPTDANGNPDPNPPVEGLLRFGSIKSTWDNFIENGSSAAITSFADPSAALLGEYTGNDLFCNSPIAIAQNSGVEPRTYAPATFSPGSSYSHWDESTYPIGDPNSLMSPFIAPGEAIHDPGLVTLGFMEDMGWSICGGSLTVDEFTVDAVEISPNPFTSSIAIKLSNGANDDYTVNLFDINGRVVMNETLTATNGNLTLSNLDKLGDALYFVKITNDFSGSSITKKVIKN